MPGESDTERNVDRLVKHLKAESLAMALVRAHGAEHPEGKLGSMKAVLTERIAQAKAKLDDASS